MVVKRWAARFFNFIYENSGKLFLALSASLFTLGCILSVVSISNTYKERNELKLRLNTIIKEEKFVLAMSEALQVEFEISPVEADCYARIYRKWARLRGVEWTRLAAVTYVESRFDPTLTSKANAQGLMQLMKATKGELCYKRGIRDNNTTAWRDVVNLDLGCDYLSSLIVKYKDTIGVAAYNVGPCNIDTFKVSQKAFTDSVFKYDRRLQYVFEGAKVRSGL